MRLRIALMPRIALMWLEHYDIVIERSKCYNTIIIKHSRP